jgi:proline iminopeptidase
MKYQNTIIAVIIFTMFAACTKQRQINQEGNLVPKTVEFDPSVPSISVNGTKFHSEAFGNPSDPMVIVLHGGPGGDYRYLLNNTAFVNNNYYVVFYDQRGSGLSQRHPKSAYTIQVMLDDLNAVIAHYKTGPNQKVFLLGHSWGAMLATAFINKYPTAIKGAILAEPGGLKWNDIKDYVSRSQEFGFSSEATNDATYLDQFITGKKDQHAVLDYKFMVWASTENYKDSPLGNEGSLPVWRNGAVINAALFAVGEKEKPDFTTNLSQYTTKVLFVYSERNKAYGLAHAQNVSSAFPNVQLFKVNEAGHDMISFPAGWNNFYPVALSYLNSLR